MVILISLFLSSIYTKYLIAANTQQLMKQLRKILLRLKGEFMTEDGSGVNYNLMGKSDAFHAYKNLASNLRLDFLMPLYFVDF